MSFFCGLVSFKKKLTTDLRHFQEEVKTLPLPCAFNNTPMSWFSHLIYQFQTIHWHYHMQSESQIFKSKHLSTSTGAHIYKAFTRFLLDYASPLFCSFKLFLPFSLTMIINQPPFIRTSFNPNLSCRLYDFNSRINTRFLRSQHYNNTMLQETIRIVLHNRYLIQKQPKIRHFHRLLDIPIISTRKL